MRLITIIIIKIVFCHTITAQITFTDDQQIVLKDTIEVVAKEAKSKLGYNYLYLKDDTITLHLSTCQEGIDKIKVLVARGERFIASFHYDTSFHSVNEPDSFFIAHNKEVNIKSCTNELNDKSIKLSIYPLDILLDDCIIFNIKLKSEEKKIYTKVFFLKHNPAVSRLSKNKK